MATYQKRGYKKSVEIEEEEVIVDNEGTVEESTTAEVFNTLEETANKSEQFIEKNSKPLLIGLVAAVVIIFGYIGYTQFIEIPTEKKAANALVYAKQAFTKANTSDNADDFNTALNGADGNYGLIDIADNYGSTDAGNLAKYYAGISYFNLKEYEKAIDYLKSVSTSDPVLKTVIDGSIGDAYFAQNNTEEALDYFSEAATTSQNKAIAPVYLLKAGKLALAVNDYSKAEELFTSLKEDYPTSSQATNIDLYLNQAKYAN
ncbi:YfgM family protein [Wenyingzhuangia sp. IMCC45533]